MKQTQETQKSLVTPLNLLENTRRWRQTYKGLTANLYGKIKERSRKMDRQHDEFTLSEFRDWFKAHGGYGLWEKWRDSNYLAGLRPSVDRISCLDGYRFENIQLISAEANRRKGDEEKLILWGKPIRQINSKNQVVAIYPNIKKAMEITGVNRNNISSVLHGKRKSAGGYRWELIR